MMPDVSRRGALLAAASGIAALAGCSGSETASNSYPTAGRPVEGYELERVRDETGGALVDADEATSSPSTEDSVRRRRRARRVLVSSTDLDDVPFAEGPESDALRSFLAETDFELASAYLLTMPVEACRELRLRSVSVEPDELADGDLQPHADFCRAYRPADVDCDAESFHTVGFAIRLPVAADRSHGSGMGTAGSCLRGDSPTVFNASAASADGANDGDTP
jgi:hypothetical protein